jgi:hypothetical protein
LNKNEKKTNQTVNSNNKNQNQTEWMTEKSSNNEELHKTILKLELSIKELTINSQNEINDLNVSKE